MEQRWPHMRTDRFWVLLFACYYAFQVVYRIVLGGALPLDESQTILDAQNFAFGYGPQPPLYAWLQRLVFLVLGDTLFSIALFKNALLFGTVFGVFLVLRRFYDARTAGLGATGLLLLHQISWESQRDLSHSVIVAFFAVWSIVVLARVLRKPDWVSFALLGIVLGLGCLSKYNYIVFATGLLLSALSFPQTRTVIFQKKLILSVILIALIVAPHVFWVMDHMSFALSSSGKFKIEDQNSLMTGVQGFGAVILAVINFAALVTCVTGFVYFRYRATPVAEHSDLPVLLRVLLRGMLIGLGLIAIGVVVSGATSVKDRWLIPNLIWIAPLAVLWVCQRVSETGLWRLMQTYGVLALLVIIGLPLHIYMPGSRRAAPFPEMAQIINAQTPTQDALIAPSWVAGNLYYFAQRPVYRYEDLKGQQFDSPMTLVWEGEDQAVPGRIIKRRLQGWRYDDTATETHGAPFVFDWDRDYVLSFVRLLPPEQ